LRNSARLIVITFGLGCLVAAFQNCSNPAVIQSSTTHAENGTSYGGMVTRYVEFDLNNPCPDVDVNGSPLPNQILYLNSATGVITSIADIMEARLIRTNCSFVVPAQMVPKSALTYNAGDIIFNGDTFTPPASNAVIPSVDQTAVPPAASLTDEYGAVWTFSGGQLYRNGILDPVTNGVIFAEILGGIVYQETTHIDPTTGGDQWFYYSTSNSTDWVQMSGPPNPN
jgi:hypothetical protein